MRAADHHPVEAARRHRRQAGLQRGDQVVHHGRRRPAAPSGRVVPSRSTSSSTCACGGTGRSASESSQRSAWASDAGRAAPRLGHLRQSPRLRRTRRVTPSLKATWSGGRSVDARQARPRRRARPRARGPRRRAASRARAGWARTSCRRRRTWAPQRAVRKSSSGVGLPLLAHPHDDPARRTRAEPPQPGLVGHEVAVAARSASAPSGTAHRSRPGSRHRSRAVGVEAQEDDAAPPGRRRSRGGRSVSRNVPK